MIADSLEFDILCMSCMQNKGSTAVPCPHCDYDERQQKSHPLYLQPRTLLKNQYLIGKPLGQGGFGITYVGLDKWLQKKVAIKEYLPSALATRDFLTSAIVPVKKQEDAFKKGLQLFIHEARHLAKFDHPNIVRVINFFEENQTGYMVMEYLEGDSPEAILTQTGGRLPVTQALAIILPILDALAEVHAQHLYHCDISAQNLRILTTGVPILIDFGAARHVIGEQSRSLTVVLKHGYSPLEQYSGKGKIGPWTDVYACSALLYLMITGNLPPAATDRFGEDALIAPINLPDIDISNTLNNAIMRALGIKSEERFQTVQEFKAALEGKLTVTPPAILQPVPTPLRQVRSRSRKKITTIIVLIVVSTGLFFYFNKNTIQSPLLLEKAQMQWANGKLTVPPGDNASETYRIILKLEPDNATAKTGLLKIAEHFYNLARQAQERGQITDSLEQVKHGLQIMPTHVKLRTLEQELMTSFTAQQQAQTRAQQVQQLLDQAAHYLATAQLESAYTVYQEILTKAPDNQQARAGLQQLAKQYEQLAHRQKDDIVTSLAILGKGLTVFPKHPGLLSLKQELIKEKLTKQHEVEKKLTQQRQIEELLKTAQQQLLALRLTEPTGDNAYETYQQILNLAPNHPEANAGFIKIANEYERLARIKQDNWQKNLALIDKGLKVLPNHAGLLALRQTVTQLPPLPKKASEPPLPVAKVNTPVTSPPSKEISASVLAHHTTNVVPIPKATASTPEVKATDLNKLEEILSDQPVQKELVIAKQQLEAGQVEEAIQTYQNILQKAPNNKEATTGLQRIARHYETLAHQQTQENHWTASLSLINKGLAAAPTDVGLLTLQEEITRRLKNEQPPPKETKSPQNIIFTPSF